MAWDFLVSVFLLSVAIPAKKREISTPIRAIRGKSLSFWNGRIFLKRLFVPDFPGFFRLKN